MPTLCLCLYFTAPKEVLDIIHKLPLGKVLEYDDITNTAIRLSPKIV